MTQGDFMNYIGITLQTLETNLISRSVWYAGEWPAHLSLQDARNLAFSLIQHVHLAEVRRSLKQQQHLASKERSCQTG